MFSKIQLIYLNTVMIFHKILLINKNLFDVTTEKSQEWFNNFSRTSKISKFFSEASPEDAFEGE